jgi:hypothetical protein
MSNPSNLYAEKIFSEHPIAFWALDDVADYVSLISEEQRSLTSWQVSNATAQIEESLLDEPFPNSVTSRIIGNFSGEDFSVECVSPDIVSLSELDSSLASFSIGAFVYADTEYINGFDIGYEYYDTVSGETVREKKFISTEIYKGWIFISETFSPRIQNTNIRIILGARYFAGLPATTYDFLVNGITLGQWSEEFNATSLGVVPEIIPYPIFSSNNVLGIPAKSYGLKELDGYYVVSEKTLLAKNSSIPMVFGGSNLTTLQKKSSENFQNFPSLVVPGQGFLNESGRHNDYSFEFWLRVSSDSVDDYRIVGNIGGTDGLYVKGPFLSLKINNHVIRHYVGEWFRPMLVHIRYSSKAISLLINGELVGQIYIDSENIVFPEKISLDGLDNDWIGFYPGDEASPFEIDAVAIYGYEVPVQVAKRRFIYGQGVEFPENINNAYSGSSVFIDYPFSKYSKNYSYPKIGRWSQGSYDNLQIRGNSIGFPEYKKPKVIFNDQNYLSWIEDLKNAQNEFEGFISLKPNSNWESTNGYILVDGLTIDGGVPKTFYMVCKEKEPTASDQTLLVIEDGATQNYFEIILRQSSIDYIVSTGGQSSIIASKPRYFAGVGEKFVIGIDVSKFSNYYGQSVAQFFGRLSASSIYVGGRKDFTNTFKGNLYQIGFCSAKNSSKVASAVYFDGTFLSDEFVDGNYLDELADAGTDLSQNAIFDFIYDGGTFGEYSQLVVNNHISSYHISVEETISGFDLVVGAESSWEDYLPLSLFAKNVLDSRGDERLDLDFIQFNVNYPAPSSFVQDESEGSWSYEELRAEYSNPVQRKYTSLDNSLFTGFENYEDLKNRAENSYRYDTSASVVRTYVTFQLLSDGANRSLSTYSHLELTPKSGIVKPDDSWINTAYEVVDGVIIYPPQSISFDRLAMVTHIEMSSPDIANCPISIKSLEYASLSLSETAPTAIGTRFGNDIFPYRKDGFYFTYKNQNPFTIYKKSSPYLYLTRDSGITVKGIYDPIVNRGVSIPINPESAPEYQVIAMQLSMRFDQDLFPYAPTQIFELQSRNSYIRIYMVAAHPSGKRAKIYAINEKGKLESGIAFYVNGKIVKEPHITVKEWAMLGISFANIQNFNNYSGAFRVTGPLTVNNVSYYKSTSLQIAPQRVLRPWFKVRKAGALILDWEYWNAIPYLWGGDNSVLVISSKSYYAVDPSDIYKVYTGTNKIIVDDEIEMVFGDYSYTGYKDVSWTSIVQKPV